MDLTFPFCDKYLQNRLVFSTIGKTERGDEICVFQKWNII